MKKYSAKGRATEMHSEFDKPISSEEIVKRINCSTEEADAIIAHFSDGELGNKEFRFLQEDMSIMNFLSEYERSKRLSEIM